LQKIFKAVPSFVKALKTETNHEVIIDALWALSYITDGDKNSIELCLGTDIVDAVA